MVARRHGLQQLLRAPISTRDFCLQEDGHLHSVTTAAVEFVCAITGIRHTHAEYLLLRYCASTLLNHLPRLADLEWMRGYAEQLVLEGSRVGGTISTGH